MPAALIDLIRAVGADRRPRHRLARGRRPARLLSTTRRVGCSGHRTCPKPWPEQLSRDELSARLGLPAHIANDADLAAVGEAAFGAGAGTADVAYLTISTGIGAGVVYGGRLLRGTAVARRGRPHRHRLAAPGGTVCRARSRNWGRAVAWRRMAHEAGLGVRDAQEVEAAAASGDARAIAIWQGAIAACAAGVSNLVMSFYPSTVVIGGGLGRQEEFFGPVRELVLQPARAPSRPTCRSCRRPWATTPGWPVPRPGPTAAGS